MGSTRVTGCLKNRGFNAFVVFGPSHHSKSASFKRYGEREAARITAYEAKVETMIVAQSMQKGTKTRHERDVLATQLVVQDFIVQALVRKMMIIKLIKMPGTRKMKLQEDHY